MIACCSNFHTFNFNPDCFKMTVLKEQQLKICTEKFKTCKRRLQSSKKRENSRIRLWVAIFSIDVVLFVLCFRQKSYPEVSFRSYKDRKRILVCNEVRFLLWSPNHPSSCPAGDGRSGVRGLASRRQAHAAGPRGDRGRQLLHGTQAQRRAVAGSRELRAAQPRYRQPALHRRCTALRIHSCTILLQLHAFTWLAVDEIYHLASPASPPNYMYNPIKTIKTNTLGTINVLGEKQTTFITGFEFAINRCSVVTLYWLTWLSGGRQLQVLADCE